MLVEMVYTTAYSNITISIIVTIVGDSSTSSELIQKMETHNAATVAGEDMHLAPTLHFYPGGQGRDQDFLPPYETRNLQSRQPLISNSTSERETNQRGKSQSRKKFKY